MTNRADQNRQVIEEFRANRGTGGGPWAGRPLLLLTTTGARTGRPYTAPMMYMPDGDRLIVFTSNIGAPRHPDWYHNLVAHPDVTVEAGDETHEATATVTTGADRERLWTTAIAHYPFFTEHQSTTTRQIPLIALHRPEQQT